MCDSTVCFYYNYAVFRAARFRILFWKDRRVTIREYQVGEARRDINGWFDVSRTCSNQCTYPIEW